MVKFNLKTKRKKIYKINSKKQTNTITSHSFQENLSKNIDKPLVPNLKTISKAISTTLKIKEVNLEITKAQVMFPKTMLQVKKVS